MSNTYISIVYHAEQESSNVDLVKGVLNAYDRKRNGSYKKTVVIQIFCKYGKENAPINHTLKVDNGFSFPHAPFLFQNIIL